MPGCERFEETGPDAYDITLRVGISAIKGTYEGTVKVTERSPEDSYRLSVDGGGKPGKVQGTALMQLTEDGGGTRVAYSGDIKAQGAIARLGSRLLGGSAKMLIGQFFKEMDKQVKQRAA